MALLTGDLAKKVFKAFKGKLLTGLIRQTVTPDSGALDDLGDPLDSAPVDTAIEGFTEDYSAYFRATAGIPDTDTKVNIFAESCPGLIPSKDDKVKLIGRFGAQWYQLRSAATDPATALWVCRAFPIPEPE